MAFKISNHISDYMQERYPKMLSTIYGDGEGHKLTGLDILHALLYTYERRSQLGQHTNSYNVLCDFPNSGVYARLHIVATSTHACLMRLVAILEKEGLVDVIQSGNIAPNKGYTHASLEYGGHILQEAKYTADQAAKESPIQLANFMFQLPDAAIGQTPTRETCA